MPKTFDEVKSFLEKTPEGKDYLEAVISTVEAERQKGVLESQKTNKEAQNLRKYKIAFEGLGYNPEEHQLEDFISSLKSEKETASKAKETKVTLDSISKDFNDLKANFEKTQAELAKERKQAQELKDKATKSKMKEVLTSKLGNEIYGADLIIESLIAGGKVGIDENENVLFKEGDTTLDLDTGVKKFLESRPDIKKNNQHPGADSRQTTDKAPDPNTDQERLKSLRRLGRNIF
jgi:hypothetical protein